jgi:hypothetical protein
VVVGLALAVAYHLFAARTQRLALGGAPGAGPAAVIGGYFLRITIIVVILFVLGYFTSLDILAVCLAFVVLFTLLNIWSIYSLMSKRKAPPPAGTPGI